MPSDRSLSRLQQAWQSRGPLAWALLPVAGIFAALTFFRRLLYHFGVLKSSPVSLPVVVVGNITVGGTGKTPLCAYLVKHFQAAGWKPGIVSRGYGGQRHIEPRLLTASDTAAVVGDEPLMLYRQTQVPVCVCVQRVLAVEALAQYHDVDIVFSDDGLQHLNMPRVAEVIVVDGQRGFGNRWPLPAGPLREPVSRIKQADLVMVQHSGTLQHALAPDLSDNTFELTLQAFKCLNTGQYLSLQHFAGQRVIALAGIAYPPRFFNALRAVGLDIVEAPRPDHCDYSVDDDAFHQPLPVITTQKDAVKIQALSMPNTKIYATVTQIQVSAAAAQHIDRLEQQLRTHCATHREHSGSNAS